MKTIISKTGTAFGWGSDPFKWVSHLTRDERVAVKNGDLVLVLDCPTHAGNPSFRAVIYENGQYTHRIPDSYALYAALDAGQLNDLRQEIERLWQRPSV